MKTKLIVVLASLALLTSCNKDNADALFFKAKVDGKAYEATGVNAFATADSDDVLIYGIFDEKRSLYISLDPSKGVGTHQLNERPNFGFYRNENDVAFRSDYTGASGEVTITEKSASQIKGTFKCVVKEGPRADAKQATVTEGAFSVKFR